MNYETIHEISLFIDCIENAFICHLIVDEIHILIEYFNNSLFIIKKINLKVENKMRRITVFSVLIQQLKLFSDLNEWLDSKYLSTYENWENLRLITGD